MTEKPPTEALTGKERDDLLRSVGYTPDVEAPMSAALDEAAQVTPGEMSVLATVLNGPIKPPKRKRKREPDPDDEVTATSPMYDNAWQDSQFQARKAVVGKGFDADEASEHNRTLWKALGDERMRHNAEVRSAQRARSGTGKLKDVITAERDYRETVADAVKALRELPEDVRTEAIKRLG